jgi:hypothetical protein
MQTDHDFNDKIELLLSLGNKYFLFFTTHYEL